AKTTSFKQWSESLAERANDGALEAELSYWLAEQLKITPAGTAAGAVRDSNLEGTARTIEASLDFAETRALLQEVPQAYHTEINDVLLTALLRAHTRWSGKSVLAIELEGHGREEILEGIDVSRTVGWFTAAFPVVLEEQENSSLCDTLKSVKERLRAIPNRGLGHGMLRYLRGERQIEEELRGLPQPDIGFNYLGQLDQSLFESTLLKVSSVRCGALRSERARRTHLLDVVGALIDRRL